MFKNKITNLKVIKFSIITFYIYRKLKESIVIILIKKKGKKGESSVNIISKYAL